jgi:hypothetical protein
MAALSSPWDLALFNRMIQVPELQLFGVNKTQIAFNPSIPISF